MNKQLLDEVLYCLSDERTVFHYFKDKYCLFLLSQYITKTTKVQALKQSPWGHLCHKPAVKKWLAQIGSQHIEPAALDGLWSTQLHHFTMTLGSWGGDRPCWQQTCRKGHNLVLQLNFTNSHDRRYRQMLASDYGLFECGGHPIHDRRNTMAWARLDISEDFTEVLIEEIQNDWLRYAKDTYVDLLKDHSQRELKNHGIRHWKMFQQYYLDLIEPVLKVWDEAILCATLEYIQGHLGADRIFMYEHETGIALKSMDSDWAPPKSLYSRLPKKFGFGLTDQAPEFIQNDRFAAKKIKKLKKNATPKWYLLNLKMEEMKHAS